MIDFILLMYKPLLACLILTGIHAYLGLHVVERKVIFVDLALAQIAALGATVAFLFGFGLHERMTYWFSLGSTVIGAVLFALTRTRKEKVPHEAIIGIVYAVSTALSILILSRNAEGDEEIRHMLIGNILLVENHEIVKMGILYALIGFIHWHFRKSFMLISTKPEEAFKRGMNVRAWDLLFYLTFGIVVTSSVQIAGVLLVFSYLIVPAVCAMLFVETVRGRLIFGWATGTLTSIFGIFFSYYFDFPTGAAIVCAFGCVLLLLAGFRRLAKS